MGPHKQAFICIPEKNYIITNFGLQNQLQFRSTSDLSLCRTFNHEYGSLFSIAYNKNLERVYFGFGKYLCEFDLESFMFLRS